MEFWKTYAARLSALSAYRAFLQLEPVCSLKELVQELAKEQSDGEKLVACYAETCFRLQETGHDSLGAYLWEHLRYDETPYGDAAARGVENEMLRDAARKDIETFAALAAMDASVWKEAIGAVAGSETAAFLPAWKADESLSFSAVTEEYRKNGAGEYARYKAFLWADHTLLPVADPDLEEHELVGYEQERAEVQENTRALLAGHSVNNMLLYGSAGTGKSATVKSLLKVPEFGDLRIIQIDKEQLADIPALMRRLEGLRQKFVLFIDDLSFETADVGYSVLKTVLEGSIEKRPANVVIYATSNRRHLLRETFSERGEDEINIRESIEERTALAERFGIRVLFRGLNKNQYLEMVQILAKQVELNIEIEELNRLAIQWEREHAGRTPRIAQQLIRYLQGL